MIICGKRILAIILSACLIIAGMPKNIRAEESRTESQDSSKTESQAAETNGGKYVKDVFIAYGKTVEDAENWLTSNGWEPLKGGSNVGAGKASSFDDEIAVCMGIKRTDKVEEAITDMAVMNMKGGYSFDDYDALIDSKKSEIDEFIKRFFPAIEEFRHNYNGQGSELGKKRADMAYGVLNRLYDGDPKDVYAANDTGMKLGDLLLSKTREEGNEKGGDLTQIILESSGPAVLLIEQMLAIGSDDGDETWLERLSALSGENLMENLEKYVPEIAGQDLAYSAAVQLLQQQFGDAAEILSSQWIDVHEEMSWLETYSAKNNLWEGEGESQEDYDKRIEAFIKSLGEDDENADRYYFARSLYSNLYEVPYEGEWGSTLGDFFNPSDEKVYGTNTDLFLPMAAALSEGQRVSLDMLSLTTLLSVGFVNEEALTYAMPTVEDIFKDVPQMSVYTGINRGIFRRGVALTNAAQMAEKMGNGAAFDQLYSPTGIMAITAYTAAAVGTVTLVAGTVMAVKGYDLFFDMTKPAVAAATQRVQKLTESVKLGEEMTEKGFFVMELEPTKEALKRANKTLNDLGVKQYNSVGIAGRWMMGIGGSLMIAAAIVSAIQLSVYYHRDFTEIPRMIVDEADIVTYVKDEDGKQVIDAKGNPVKNISFDQYVYYDAVKCNRQQVGKICDWQSGVSDYDDWGCGDIADLNGDYGQEWLALYVNRSTSKGNPILADTLVLKYGSDKMPENCNLALHFFTYTYPVDLGDAAYSFNNGKHGIYIFWHDDENAVKASASSFTPGHLALAAAVGLAVGILAATFLLLPKRKKETLTA